ncbi:MAG TPA: S9 family peptidase, partial [Acidimicrobiales bacterium]|nr:S9 family peptidase [Acidimicrobiales bacterium]
MTRRKFKPEDFYRLKTSADPNVSPDGHRVAWTQMEVAEQDDRAEASVWVALVDGSSEPRRFSQGPSDGSPRWSPDGRWLAFVSAPAGEPFKAHLRLGSLDGGAPFQLGDFAGPVSQPAWSPDSTRLALIARVGAEDPSARSAIERNAPRRVRGLADRLDGVGVHAGRRHLFVVEVASGEVRQLTRGDYDHADPAWSPDGSEIVVVSDRSRNHDDRQFSGDVWVVPSAGGRLRKVTGGGGRIGAPTFSPDGQAIAFAGHLQGDSWNADSHIFVVPAGGGQARQIAPGTDRGVPVMPGAPPPYRWMGDNQIAMLASEGGAVRLHVAGLSRRLTREVVGGDRQIDGFSLAPSNRTVAFTAMWPDRPSEVWLGTLASGETRQLTHFNDALVAEVELAPVRRAAITRPDGTVVEYFTLAPPADGRKGGSRPRHRLHLDIHGGPHGFWPAGRFLAFHQAIAAAGYVVLLPNPRGSTGYGQDFTSACTNDWGGEDYEDILACCDDLIAKGIVDENAMFVSGGSYGGFMTAWIVGHSHRFRAATAVAAVIDQASLAFTTEIPDFCRFNFGGTPWDKADEFKKRSPLTYLPDVRTPVLVV